MGNWLFLAGALLEIAALQCGVNTWAVATSTIIYGSVLLATGYLR